MATPARRSGCTLRTYARDGRSKTAPMDRPQEQPNGRNEADARHRLRTRAIAAMRDWCRFRDSNPRPSVYKTVALPTELNRRRASRSWLPAASAWRKTRKASAAGRDGRGPGALDGDRLVDPRPWRQRHSQEGERRLSPARTGRPPSGMVTATPGLIGRSPPPPGAPPQSPAPESTYRSPRPPMSHRVPHRAGRQLEMRHAAARRLGMIAPPCHRAPSRRARRRGAWFRDLAHLAGSPKRFDRRRLWRQATGYPSPRRRTGAPPPGVDRRGRRLGLGGAA